MSTTAERQRKRRQRLKRQGIVDVSVTIPQKHADILRQFASKLRTGAPPIIEPGRLIGAISALKSIQHELKEAGISRAGVFGSTARGDDRLDSDIDIVLDVDAKRLGDILNYIDVVERIKAAITNYFPDATVEIADRATLKPRVRQAVDREAIYAY